MTIYMYTHFRVWITVMTDIFKIKKYRVGRYIIPNNGLPGAWIAHLVKFWPFKGNTFNSNKELIDRKRKFWNIKPQILNSKGILNNFSTIFKNYNFLRGAGAPPDIGWTLHFMYSFNIGINLSFKNPLKVKI